MTPEDRIRGERARQLLDDEVLISALDAMERENREAILACRDLENAPTLVMRLQAINEFRNQLRRFVAQGIEPEPARRGIA